MARAPKAKRYAQALFALAQNKGKDQAWLGDLRDAARLLDDPDVKLYFGTPRISAEKKLEAVRELLHGKDPMVVNTVGLLVTRQSMSLLPAVADEYQTLLDESLGRVHAAVTSAIALSGDQEKRLQGSLSQVLEKDVALSLKEEPSIIGGLMVRVGDQIIDGTIRSRLDAMRRQLAHETLT